MIELKQPQIKLFGQIYDVVKLEFHPETGELNCIGYKSKEMDFYNIIVPKKQVDYGNGIVEPLEKPMVHPTHKFVVAPDLNALFV